MSVAIRDVTATAYAIDGPLPEVAEPLALESTPEEELRRALAALDELLNREVRRLQARDRVTRDELQGLYVSDERIERLLGQPTVTTGEGRSATDITARLAQTAPWRRLTDQLSLTQFERAVLLLTLAPEVDLKYEVLYGYLNNDVTRKWPARELALRLFTPAGESPAQYRHLLAPQAPLMRMGIVRPTAMASEHPAWLAGGLKLDPSVAHFLLGGRDPSAYLAPPLRLVERTMSWEGVPISSSVRSAIRRIPAVVANAGCIPDDTTSPLIVFAGRAGNGQTESAAALAEELAVGVLHIDLLALRQIGDRLSDLCAAAILHQLLYGSLILIEGLDTLLDRETESAPAISRAIERLLEESSNLVIVLTTAEGHHSFSIERRMLRVRFDTPAPTDRTALWSAVADAYDLSLPEELPHALADRFILTPGQIRNAVRDAVDRCALSGDQGTQASSIETTLFEAARTQTRVNATSLTMRTPTSHGWDDLVLPDATLRQVREVAAAIKYRTVVYDDWGFAGRLARGRGLTVLFSGVSGTGKTMAAAIVAKELGVDLYTIDLSSVVSKYIGETEKNLDRVFRAAHQSNAILFFDEADAIFGKRSEVKDAHDRYANIEVAYLLQKMEEHEGAVILATNLSRNIDQAFARRIQYVVEFPTPNETYRERLWHGMFPANAPLGADVDFAFLAREFEIAGGDIRNVALDAAFLAAQNGRVVTMRHLIAAMARQVRKQGRTPSAADFKQYFSLITRDV